ncbi:hypothetical protein MKZ38_003714 [Zalerion maritima]|uniref:C2H2-type domain-containing protein n=1 Tax=Zalerion maritima TaxID=339359 RepID=A0AAD5RYA4_9PEZI|nr:hypothetical protein MKZ38_003714 [Zalerion maritima]
MQVQNPGKSANRRIPPHKTVLASMQTFVSPPSTGGSPSHPESDPNPRHAPLPTTPAVVDVAIMSTAEEIFDEGLRDFRARLSGREYADFQDTTLSNLKRKMDEIQRQQELNKSTMNMRRIERFLEGMNQISQVVEVFLNASEIVCFIWGPIKFLLVSATAHMDTFDSLLDAYKELGMVLPQLDQYSDMFGQYPEMKKLLAEIYCEILNFHRKAMRFFNSKGLTKTFRAMWKNFAFEFRDTLRSIRCCRDALVQQFAICSTIDGRQSQTQIRINVEECLSINRELRKKFAIDEETRKNNEMIKVQEWIGASNFTKEHHQKFREQRAEFEDTECKDTGRWIVDPKKGKYVEDWIKDRSTDHSILWMNGKKGAGKSFLASIIIDECMKEEDAITSYFYCHERDPNQNTSLAVFRGLLSQLAQSCPDLAPCLFSKRAAATMTITSMEAKGLLELMLERRQYIIIDGVDECEQVERKQIIQFFAERTAKSQAQGDSKMRVMFVSQSLMDIRKVLQSPGINPRIVDLRPDDRCIDGDISRFVDLRMKEMQKKFRNLTPAEVTRIKKSCKTGDAHEGMFLFAHLVTHNLLQQPTIADLLRETDETFPSSLSQAYARIMERMKRELEKRHEILWHKAVQLLSWMACAKRPMKWYEMQAVMSLSGTKINYRLFSLREDATTLCGSLIHTLKGGRLEFIHSTARDYLLEPDNEYFHSLDVEIELTNYSLEYLTYDCFAKNVNETAREEYANAGQYSLQDYAVSKWMHHLEALMHAMKSGCSPSLEQQERFTGALNKFTSMYKEGLQRKEFKTQEQKDKQDQNEAEAIRDCAPFESHRFYKDLLLVWKHVLVHEGASWDIRNKVNIPDLLDILKKNRKTLQKLWGEGEGEREKQREKSRSRTYREEAEESQLEEYYGNKFFKCDRVTCDHFWEGFEKETELKSHTNRHDRPFHCVVENCSLSRFGFPSSKDCDRHIRTYHPDHPDAGPSPFPQLNRRKVGEAKFGCKHCDKSFTRHINLKSHVLSHFGEKPFSCGTCGKCFTRINDCRRHEKIHTRRVR